MAHQIVVARQIIMGETWKEIEVKTNDDLLNFNGNGFLRK